MRRHFNVFVISVLVFVVSGCASNKTRVGEGAGIGGVVGAAAGGIIGHQSGHGAEGALIGGAIGSAGGAAVGAQMKKSAQEDAQVQPSGQLTMQQIVDLTRQGVSSDEIISKIKAAKPTYSLTADDIAYLRRENVSQRVIETMQAYR